MTRRQEGTKKGPGKKAALCGANKTRGDGTCGHPAGWGTPHPGRGRCKWHGGSTPNHVKAAQREAAAEAVEMYGLPREVEPTDALLEEIHRTAGHVAWLEQRVRALDPDELVFGKFKEAAKTTGAGEAVVSERRVERRAGISMLVKLYREERRHLVDVCRVAIAAGIAERQVRVAEHQAAIFATALRGIVEDLGVGDHPKLGKIVRRHLTLVDGAAA